MQCPSWAGSSPRANGLSWRWSPTTLRRWIGFIDALRNPIPTRPVPEGPCQEVVYLGDQVDLSRLSIPTQGRLDPGPYILAGIQISYDPHDTGSRNASIYRMQLKGRNRLALSAHAFQDISVQFSRAEARIGRWSWP